MDEVHRSHVNEKETLVNDISNTEQSIVDCENSVQGLEDRYRFFQEMRGYVRDLVECLNEKVGHLFMLGGSLCALCHTGGSTDTYAESQLKTMPSF